jgi:hypothetical protein
VLSIDAATIHCLFDSELDLHARQSYYDQLNFKKYSVFSCIHTEYECINQYAVLHCMVLISLNKTSEYYGLLPGFTRNSDIPDCKQVCCIE